MNEIERMREKAEASMKRFREEGKPYFCYRTGGKRFGCTRIGRWTETWETKDYRKGVEKHRAAFTIDPKKILRVLKGLRHDLWQTEIHLWTNPLPEGEQAEFRAALAGYDVIWDERK